MIGAAAFALAAALGGAPSPAALGGPPSPAPPARDSLLSRRLTAAALDQEAALRTDSAIALYRAARRADPADLVAEYHYASLRQRRFEFAALRGEYAASAAHWNPRGAFCWTPWVTEIAESRATISQVVDAERSLGRTPCTTALLGTAIARDTPLPFDEQARTLERAAHRYPSIMAIWVCYAEFWDEHGNPAKAEDVYLEGERAVGHPLLRVELAGMRIGHRMMQGDSTGARALQRSLRSAALRDGRPGIVATYLMAIAGYREAWADEGGEPAIVARMLGLSRSTGDWMLAAHALTDQGKLLIDGGEPARAIPLLTRAVEIADSVKIPDLQLLARTSRGRAYTKAGRLAEAERDLLMAVGIGDRAARLYARADAWHNLAHLYESESRWPEANAAAGRFVATAKPLYSSEVTSLLDEGEIRWKAGWHASAEDSFRDMVRAIDRAKVNWYYAGQYYERAGELDRARSYYVRAVTQLPNDPLALAGMSRVHAALGHADSAEYWARAHDARIGNWPPLEVPLLPDLLAKRGRFAEATGIAHAWAARQVQAGNVEGAALATLQVAQLLLDAGHADSAVAETRRTDSLARGASLTRETIRARVLRGTALRRLGRGEAGMRALDSALALATAHPSADLLSETHLALGDAYAAATVAAAGAAGAARTDDALREYDAAARAVESTTFDISGYFDRAGFRDRNLRPFDGALRLLLGAASRPRRDDEFVKWVSRRNAAALAFGARGAGGSTRGASHETSAPGLAELQARLRGDERMISYVMMDSTVAAMIVTKSGARLARLPIGAAALAARVEELRRPFTATYSGRLDMARVRYDLGAATALYAALIEPFAAELAGAKRLLIAPDGALHQLAFDALVEAPQGAPTAAGSRSTDFGSARYLIDAYEIEYLPSPAFLRARAARDGGGLRSARLLAVGYAAPGSAEEIAALREVWPRAQTTAMTDAAATAPAVRRAMTRYDLVHFAVHASADTRDPLASHLVLAPDSASDGFLHANEIAAARTNAQLVVLSACETNAGPVYGGEGVMGLARAFLAGGAGAVVATQWPIGAETAVLMREFYARLARGETPAEALRGAKLMVRKTAATAHPVHWAGFVLVR